ncbi:collagen-binding domain-containing protein [Sphingomonas sp. R1]|uniref:collagen-binding domain-containing protein n=1 Tax=Sphingomonas sp. R1 TaxID=399176 RepID=UPI0022257ACD|nr:collagen-binding domain-containing protein [Sphingomonas sp. R1]UYY77647.1 choice-of-anchor A family protein [Sphingomonas sp. R1]
MRRLSLSVVTAALLATGAHAAPGDAAAGLQALRELNLVVFGTLSTNGQEVEGRSFVGSLAAANFTNFGIGSTSQGSAASSYDVLSVVGNATGSFRLKAGYANGSNANPLGDTARIGGNVGYIDFNDANGAIGKLVAGGNLTTQFNVNNHKVTYGGTAAGGINGAVKDASLAAGGANDVAAGLAVQMSALSNNLTALSTQLASLKALDTISPTSSALNYSGATGGYAVFTMTEAAFTDQNANFDNLFKGMPSGVTTIINVLGTNLTERGNVNDKALNQNVIWNFSQAQSLSLKGFHGTVLAPLASLVNSSAIEGTIVAKSMQLNGEVHLGTYAGTSSFLGTSAVPEPASWALLLFGFGTLGGVLRKRRALALA